MVSRDTIAVLIDSCDFYGRQVPTLPRQICVCIECFFRDTTRANFALQRSLSNARDLTFLDRGDTPDPLPRRCNVCGRFLVFSDAG
jgi:hypothetical protein